MKKFKKLILISLNEINFDIVKKYCEKYNLNSLNSIINNNKNKFMTFSEKEYNFLEPWIQWVSVYTGLAAKDHKVFRLGDSVDTINKQIFEEIENLNFKVGAISPMNVSNVLKSPNYFIPDPWTKTKSDGSFWSELISKVLNIAVNENSKNKLNLTTIIYLILIFLRFVRIKNYISFVLLFISSFKKKWKKPIFLDLLIHEIHMNFLKRTSPNFSNVFYNAGAHIQHHYFLKSEFINNNINEDDPLYHILFYYDKILKDYINLKEYNYLISTGLSQTPNKKPTYYYRLSDHKKFIADLNIDYFEILPRMSRDFLIKFRDPKSATNANKILSEVITNKGIKLFNEIDNRGDSLFVTLTYDQEIDKETYYFVDKNQKKPLLNEVNFVAIKNGIHNANGYVFLSNNINKYVPKSEIHVKDLNKLILDYFKS